MPVRLPFRVLGAVAAALVIAASVVVSGQRGTDWSGVHVSGLIVFGVACGVHLFAPPLPPSVAGALLAVAGLALVAAYWAQPAGVPVGMFVLAAFATMRPPLPLMLIVLTGLAGLFCGVQIPSGHESVATAAAVLAGMIFFAGVGILLLSERRQRERIAGLLAELETARESERAASALTARTTAAREVHDVLAHSLSGLIIQLEAARLQAKATGADPVLQASVDNALRSARSGLTEAKRAVAALRGERPQGPADIPSLIEEHRLTTGAPTTFEVVGDPLEVGDEARLALYRAAQETLSNVRKHAPGAPVEIRLDWHSGLAALTVTNPLTRESSNTTGWGLAGIQERVEALHGTAQATQRDGVYMVRVEIPAAGRGNSSSLRSSPFDQPL